MSLDLDDWSSLPLKAKLLRLAFGVYLIVLLSGLWFGKGRR